MEYIQSLSAQTNMFLYSFGFGFLLGILYDVVRTLRIIVSRSKIFTVAVDLLYFIICGVLSFAFSLVMDSGKIRLYVAAGQVLGWLVYYFSFGSIAVRITTVVTKAVKRLISFIFRPFLLLIGKISALFKKSVKICKKIFKKSNKKAKYILQNQHSIVYNLYRYFLNYRINDKRRKNDSKKN